ncbi:hypothetical protein [Chroococcidiopsis sp. CCNUC1]|nr:hypothetical protein [Chroococcidiopsis sp. CCNUC1]
MTISTSFTPTSKILATGQFEKMVHLLPQPLQAYYLPEILA